MNLALLCRVRTLEGGMAGRNDAGGTVGLVHAGYRQVLKLKLEGPTVVETSRRELA